MADPFSMVFGLFSMFFMLMWLAFMAAMIGGIVFWIFMIIDVAKRKFPKDDDRILWILVVVLAGIIGAIIYYFMVKHKDKVVEKIA